MAFRFGGAALLALLFLILFTALPFAFSALWLRRRRLADLYLRPLPPIESLKTSLRRAAEMGEAVHLSPGTGTLHQRGSAGETLAGLEVLRGVAKEAMSLGVPVRATCNDALVNVAVEKALAEALKTIGNPPGLEPKNLLVAQHDPVAYAAGVVDTLSQPDLQGNVLMGAAGEELLLIGEVGTRETTFQVLGAARPAAASLLPLLTKDFLLGEEIYAAAAYLDPKPNRLMSLLTQDGVRMVLLVLIALGVILATVGILDRSLGLLFRMPMP